MVIPEEIRLEAVENCLLCQTKGVWLYQELRDRVWGNQGSWNFFKCPACDLIWLHPRPIVADIPKIYGDPQQQSLPAPEREKSTNFKTNIKKWLVKINFDPPENNNIGSKIIIQLVKTSLRLLPYGKKISRRPIMFLSPHKKGKLLDIGCGWGDLICQMQEQGWEVKGIEPDAAASKFLREEKGLEIFSEFFETIEFPPACFEAITMNQFIEHASDPIFCIKKAWSLLKPGGKLIISTPNIESLSHKLFKANAYILQPPRHMYLFSSKSLGNCAARAGLQNFKVWTLPYRVDNRFINSWRLKRFGSCRQEKSSWSIKVIGYAFWVLEILANLFIKNLGEELILEAEKL